MASSDADWNRMISNAIQAALRRGVQDDLPSLVSALSGADPRKVEEVRKTVPPTPIPLPSVRVAARATLRGFFAGFPAEDSLSSQWWFTTDTVEMVCERVAADALGGKVAFLGVPTAGPYYKARFGECVCFDYDEHVTQHLNKASKGLGELVDFRKPNSVSPGDFSAAVIDPPWYPDRIASFLSAAFRLVGRGRIYCAFPSELTRPGVLAERAELLRSLNDAGVLLVAVESGVLHYEVPRFEKEVLSGVSGFSGLPWRSGDLLVLEVSQPASLSWRPESSYEMGRRIARFARNPRAFRVFLDEQQSSIERPEFSEIEDFRRHISTRSFDPKLITVWSSNRRAASVRDVACCRLILELWAQGKTRAEIEGLLAHQGRNVGSLVEGLHAVFGLWPPADAPKRLTPLEIQERSRTTGLATASSAQSREYSVSSDGYRPEFPRDRDRVLWSSGLRSLANKTQVFSFDVDQDVRQRLAHSVEVMQLATTIGSSFGLDLDLIEAGSLVHDIGHTPFGHAGEAALNELFHSVAPKSGGFNHYEHGVDVVRWLEDAYRSHSDEPHFGLNLTREVVEVILKHTYCREGSGASSQCAVIRNSKHTDLFRDDGCHLEGQAVRAADKISYLISDLEDGIRLGLIGLDDLLGCRLFHRAPIDVVPHASETLLERFLAQRRLVIRVLMEDLLDETERRLSSHFLRVRDCADYVVFHSAEVQEDCSEIWEKLQKVKLHRSPVVVAANLRAARVVTELALLYSLMPELIEPAFSRSHSALSKTKYMSFYRERIGESVSIPVARAESLRLAGMIEGPQSKNGAFLVGVENLVQAKDFVSSLTDQRASAYHSRLLGR